MGHPAQHWPGATQQGGGHSARVAAGCSGGLDHTLATPWLCHSQLKGLGPPPTPTLSLSLLICLTWGGKTRPAEEQRLPTSCHLPTHSQCRQRRLGLDPRGLPSAKPLLRRDTRPLTQGTRRGGAWLSCAPTGHRLPQAWARPRDPGGTLPWREGAQPKPRSMEHRPWAE